WRHLWLLERLDLGVKWQFPAIFHLDTVEGYPQGGAGITFAFCFGVSHVTGDSFSPGNYGFTGSTLQVGSDFCLYFVSRFGLRGVNWLRQFSGNDCASGQLSRLIGLRSL